MHANYVIVAQITIKNSLRTHVASHIRVNVTRTTLKEKQAGTANYATDNNGNITPLDNFSDQFES